MVVTWCAVAASTLPPGVTAPRKPRAARGQGTTSSRPRADRAPRAQADPVPESTREISDAELTHRLASVLSAPALVMKFGAHCDPCADHFKRQGPVLAAALVEYAKDHAPIRSLLIKATAIYDSVELFPLLVMFVAFPIIHHGPPQLQPLAPLFGVPTREAVEPEHAHSAATDGTFRPEVRTDAEPTEPDLDIAA